MKFIFLLLFFVGVGCSMKLQPIPTYTTNSLYNEYLNTNNISHEILINCDTNAAYVTGINSFGIPSVQNMYIIDENGVKHIYVDAKYFYKIGYDNAKKEFFRIIQIADGIIPCK